MEIESLQFLLNHRWKCSWSRKITLFPQDMQQVRQRRPHRVYAALTGVWASAHRQMLRHEPVCQGLIHGAKWDVSSTQPAGEMLDAVKVGTNRRRAILVMLQIPDIGFGALSQSTRSKTVTISRDKHVVLLWTSTASTAEHLLLMRSGRGVFPD